MFVFIGLVLLVSAAFGAGWWAKGKFGLKAAAVVAAVDKTA